MIELRIECPPVSWLAHGGYGRNSYNRRHAEKVFYQMEWKKQYLHNFPINVAVETEYEFVFPVVKSYNTAQKVQFLANKIFHTKRPDVSNCIKFCEDTLKEIVIVDDSQVVSIKASKRYGEEPYTLVKIIPLS